MTRGREAMWIGSKTRLLSKPIPPPSSPLLRGSLEGFHYVSPGIHRHPDVMTSLSLPRSFWRGSSYINDAILLGVHPCHGRNFLSSIRFLGYFDVNLIRIPFNICLSEQNNNGKFICLGQAYITFLLDIIHGRRIIIREKTFYLESQHTN